MFTREDNPEWTQERLDISNAVLEQLLSEDHVDYGELQIVDDIEKCWVADMKTPNDLRVAIDRLYMEH